MLRCICKSLYSMFSAHFAIGNLMLHQITHSLEWSFVSQHRYFDVPNSPTFSLARADHSLAAASNPYAMHALYVPVYQPLPYPRSALSLHIRRLLLRIFLHLRHNWVRNSYFFCQTGHTLHLQTKPLALCRQHIRLLIHEINLHMLFHIKYCPKSFIFLS